MGVARGAPLERLPLPYLLANIEMIASLAKICKKDFLIKIGTHTNFNPSQPQRGSIQMVTRVVELQVLSQRFRFLYAL